MKRKLCPRVLVQSVYDTHQIHPQFRLPTVISTGNQQGCKNNTRSSEFSFPKSFRKPLCRSSPPVLIASSTVQRSSSNSFPLHSSLCFLVLLGETLSQFFYLASPSRPQSLGDSTGCDGGSSGGPALAFPPLSPSTSSFAFSSSQTCIFSPVCIILFVALILFVSWTRRLGHKTFPPLCLRNTGL